MATISADGSTTAVKTVRNEFVSVIATGDFGGGNISIEGKIDDSDWVTLETFGDDFAKDVAWKGQIRLTLAGSSSPSITYHIQGGQLFNHHNGK